MGRVVLLVLAGLVASCSATVMRNSTAIATATVTNELRGCTSSPDNLTISFRENGEREYALVKFNFGDVDLHADPISTQLHLYLVEGFEPAELNGRLQVQVVSNNWDPESIDCNSIPDAIDSFRSQKLSGLPYDVSFTLDVSSTLKKLIDDGSHVLSLLIYPEENSGEINISFGSASAAHKSWHLAPVLEFTLPDPEVPIPSFVIPPRESGIAGQQFELILRIPTSLLDKDAHGQPQLPPGALNVHVVNYRDGSDVTHTITQENVDQELGITDYVIRFIPYISGNVVISAQWHGSTVEHSPRSISIGAAPVDPQRCSSDFGTPAYFESNPLPRVGFYTCFIVNTLDTFGNPVDVSGELDVQVLAGLDERESHATITNGGSGKSSVCFDPADADLVSVSVKIVSVSWAVLEEESMVPGFPLEMDCYPGEIVPNKTAVSEDSILDTTAGHPSHIEFTTYDRADHVSNVDLNITNVEFDGPADVQWTIGNGGLKLPQNGITRVNFTASTSGYYHLTITVGDVRLGPFNFTVRPGVPSVDKTLVMTNGVPAIAGQSNVFTVVSHDEFGNAMSTGGLDLRLDVSPINSNVGAVDVEKQIVDSEDGSYTIIWMVQKSGFYSVNVGQEDDNGDFRSIEGCPFNVSVSPGPMNAAKSGFAAEVPKTIRAGEDPNIQIVERDAFGNDLMTFDRMSVVTATLTARATEDITTVALDETHDAVFTARLDLRVVGEYILVVKVNDTDFTYAEFSVIPSAACGVSSVVIFQSTSHVVNEEVSATLRLRDCFGNDLKEGGLTTIRADAIHPGTPPVKCSIEDHENGQYGLTFTPFTIGYFNVFVYINDVSVGESPYSLRVAAGEPFGPFSFAAGEGLRSSGVGERQFLVVRARDAGKNDITVGNARVTGFLERHPDPYSPSDKEYDIEFTDNEDGTYSGHYNATVSGDYSLFIRVDSKDILGSPFALRVHSGLIGPKTSVDTEGIEDNSPVAGEPIRLLVTARDIFNNKKMQGGDMITLNFTHTSGESYFASITDNQNGTYSGEVVLTKAGQYELTGTPMDQRTHFTVVPAAGSGPHSSLSGTGTHEAVAGEDTVLRLTARDVYYNDAIVGGEKLKVLLLPHGLRQVNEDDIEIEVDDEDDGSYVITYNAKVAMQYSLKVQLDNHGTFTDVIGSPSIVTVKPNVASGDYSYAAGRQSNVTAGSSVHYVLHTHDAYNNSRGVGGDAVICRLVGPGTESVQCEVKDDNSGLYYMKFTPTRTGNYYLIGFINGDSFNTKDLTMTVLPGPTNAQHTTADWGSADTDHEAGVTYPIEVSAYDVYGNPTKGRDGTWSVQVKGPMETTYGNFSDVEQIGYYIATRAGLPSLHVKFDGADIQGSPKTIKVFGSSTSAQRTVASGTGLRDGRVGEPAFFKVVPIDEFGNLATKGPIEVVVKDARGFQLTVRVQDTGDYYNISYNPVASGIHRVHIKVQGEHIQGSPFSSLVRPGRTSAAHSIAYGSGMISARTGEAAAFVIIAMDALGNPRLQGGDSVRILTHLGPEPIKFNIADTGVGEYMVSYRAPDVEATTKIVMSVYLAGELLGNKNMSLSIVNTTAPAPSYNCPSDCSNHGSCSHATGLCSCSEEWVGIDCATPYITCPLSCSNHGTCDHLTGGCQCYSGFSGDACEITEGASTYTPPVVETTFNVKRPKVEGPKCTPHDCSGNGVCIRDGVCECEVGYVGKGCETRTYYSLVSLDHGFVLLYEIATGRLHGLQQGVADDKTCSGLSPFLSNSNIIRPSQRKYVHIGSNEVLEIDPITNRGTLLTFNQNDLSKGSLTKPQEHSIGVIHTFKARELTYLGINRMMSSTDNSSTIFRVNRNHDDVLVTSQGVHTWDRQGPHGRFAYVGHEMIMRYMDDGSFALYKMNGEKATIAEPAAATGNLTDYDAFSSSSIVIHPLSHDVWFAFDYKTGNYRSYYCPFNGRGDFSGCLYLNSGHVIKGYKCPAAQIDLPCSVMSRVDCVRAPKCGYCLTSHRCMDGTELGPSTEKCAATDKGNMWIFSANEFTKQYLYAGRDRLIDFEAHSGRYNVWALDRDAANAQCRVLEDAVATGYLQNSIGHRMLPSGNDIIDFHAETGKFRIAECDPLLVESSGRLKCETWAEGTWPQFKDHALFVIRETPVLLMDVDQSNGDYRIWSLGSRAQLRAGVPLLAEKPEGMGSLPGLIAAEVTHVSSLSILIAQQTITSSTSFYEVIGGKLVEMGKPMHRGMRKVMVHGKEQLMQMRYASVGNNTLLSYGPLGYWEYLECFPYTVFGDVFGADAPVHCVKMSAGSPNPPLCSSKTTEEECTAHPSCGWCAMNLKCFAGYRAGLCSKTAPKCPSAAWKWVGGDHEPSGFVNGLKEILDDQNKVKEHDCSHSLNCRGCVADLECGWHVGSRKCVPGGPTGPADNQAYPIGNKQTDWNYSYCSGVDGCEHIKGCDDCTSASYCGWCGEAKKCMTATSTGPLFEGCTKGFVFDSCPAL
jgi:hypothetical protein